MVTWFQWQCLLLVVSPRVLLLAPNLHPIMTLQLLLHMLYNIKIVLLSLLAYTRHADTFFTLFTLWFEWKQHNHVAHLTQNSIHGLRSVYTLQNGARVMQRSRISFFFAYKKYSRSFVELRLNPWCHMGNFTVLPAFWTLIVVITLLSMGGSESSQNALKIS